MILRKSLVLCIGALIALLAIATTPVGAENALTTSQEHMSYLRNSAVDEERQLSGKGKGGSKSLKAGKAGKGKGGSKAPKSSKMPKSSKEPKAGKGKGGSKSPKAGKGKGGSKSPKAGKGKGGSSKSYAKI
jgi:hypothetical protein